MYEKKEDLLKLIGSLPEENQSFYLGIVKDPEDFDFHKEVYSVVNYELLLLSLKDKSDLTTEELKQFLPWVNDVNSAAWAMLLNDNPAKSIYPLLPDVLLSRKKMLAPTKLPEVKVNDLEKLILSCDIDELLAVLKEYGSLTQRINDEITMQCGLTEVEENRLRNYEFILGPCYVLSSPSYKPSKKFEQFFNNAFLIKSDFDFYTKLLNEVDSPEFEQNVFNTMCMEYAMSALNEKLAITPDKLTQIIKILPPDIKKDYVTRNTKIGTVALLMDLKIRLAQMKSDLPVQVEQIKAQQEKESQDKLLKDQREKERQERLLKERQEKEKQAKELKEKQEQERREQILKEQEIKQRQAPILNMLAKMHFNHYLGSFKAKAVKYSGSNRVDYILAVNAATTLVEALKSARTDFLESEFPMEIKKAAFQKACIDALDASRGVLEQHRGWKEDMTKFASLIVSVLSLGIANLATGKGIFGLFAIPKTDSGNLVTDCKSVTASI